MQNNIDLTWTQKKPSQKEQGTGEDMYRQNHNSRIKNQHVLKDTACKYENHNFSTKWPAIAVLVDKMFRV